MDRFPRLHQIIPAYAVIVLMTYGWTLLWFFWKLPSWSYYLSAGDIIGILAYSLATNFFESAVIISLLLVSCAILPPRWLAGSFAARGAALGVTLLGLLMYLANSFRSVETKDYPEELLAWLPLWIALALLLVFFAGRTGVIRVAAESFAARAVVILYVSVPASVFAVLYVVARNLL